MLLADLKQMAGGMGIAGAGTMKKAQLVEAIKAAQAGGKSQDAGQSDDRHEGRRPEGPSRKADAGPARSRAEQDQDQQKRPGQAPRTRRGTPRARTSDDRQGRDGRPRTAAATPARDGGQTTRARSQDQTTRASDRAEDQTGRPGAARDDEGGSRRNRRRRGRDRNRTAGGGGQRNEPDTTILEDDVLVPAAGILDVLDNYAFVRTSGYLPGTDDVYLSLSMVRKFGLRRGDAIVGQVRQPREGERKEKFNPMVRIDSVNGADPEPAKTPGRVRQADPALPERAAAPRDRADQPDRPGHRHRRPDRQGPARPDRVARPRPARR